MLPSLELAKALARKGHKISFISAPRNLQRLPKPPPQISNLLHFIPLPLLPVDGLPADAEATSDLPAKQVPYLKKAHDSLEQPFRQFIQETTPKPDWILQDFTQYWIPDIAAEAGVPTIFMTMMMAGTHVFFGPTSGDVEPWSRGRALSNLPSLRRGFLFLPTSASVSMKPGKSLAKRSYLTDRAFFPTIHAITSPSEKVRLWLFGAPWKRSPNG